MSKNAISTVLLLFASVTCALAQMPGTQAVSTTTTLSISPKQGTLSAGSAVALIATVAANGSPIRRGTVAFCEASRDRCVDLSVLATAQLTRNGIATTKLTLGVGTYAIRAVFRGTPRTDPVVLTSSSPLKRITVTPHVAGGTPTVAAVLPTGSK